MNAIEISGLKKRFSKTSFCLDLPALQVTEGYVTGFIGRNGAGKTTTLKLLMGLLFPDTGSIRLFGKDIATEGEAVRGLIGFVGEATGYMEQAKLQAIIEMIRPFYPGWDDVFFGRCVERFSLDLSKTHKSLSKGQQKQFALSMALAHHPRLLLLDEPTANLDPLMRSELLALLAQQLEQEGVTVFFSTHITSDLDKIADYLKFLHSGRLLLEGEKDQILERHRIVRGKKELLVPEVRDGLLGIEQNEFGFNALARVYEETYALLGDEAVYERPTVEDLFLHYVEQEKGAGK